VNILAFDTSTELCSCALWIEGEVFYREEKAGRKHSEILLPMIDSLLKEKNLALGMLDAIAFGCGPGSFTGLRIAAGVAQGLAFGAALPVIGVDSLLVLAEQSGTEKAVSCIDARMGEIYHAAHVRQRDDWLCVSAPRLCRPQESPSLEGEGWTGCGSAFETHRAALTQRYSTQLATLYPEMLPRAREIAVLAARRCSRGEVSDAASAVPLYLRDRVALRTSER
jgi:tRNA threonylcarbamoyladenosine biosynthesis protein TsaB